jgi:hypothetical protein
MCHASRLAVSLFEPDIALVMGTCVNKMEVGVGATVPKVDVVSGNDAAGGSGTTSMQGRAQEGYMVAHFAV